MILCPSAAMTEGSLLFGLIDRRGQVTYSQAAIPVTKKLLLHLPVAREAEGQFRFASACATSACLHWAEGCSLSSRLSEFQVFASESDIDRTPPECAIRARCRWYLQDGPAMCSVCQIHSRHPGL
jgi:hypothetical protein